MGGFGNSTTREDRFFDAVSCNDVEKVENMLSNLHSANDTQDDGTTALHIAALQGFDRMMKLLVSRRADVNAQDKQGRTPLMAAVEARTVMSVAFLLDNGANPEIPNANGLTPLMAAAAAGSDDVIAALVAGHADIDARDPEGRTALMLAAHAGQAVMAGTLSGYGASCTATDKGGDTAMHYAAGCAGNETTLQFLAGKAKLANAPNNTGETPLIVAVKRHNMENVQALLDLGADPTMADKTGTNALAYAAAIKRPKFRDAMKEILGNQGETVRRETRKGLDHEISVRKPLSLRRAPTPAGQA